MPERPESAGDRPRPRQRGGRDPPEPRGTKPSPERFMSRTIVIGTRGSELALWQAHHIAERLRALGSRTRIETIVTTGDRDQVQKFGEIGTKGLFVKELETALLDRSVDIAVHSLKDLPTELPEGLTLAAVPERESPFDALVSRDGLKLEELPAGSTIASGSLRRTAQALALRPDLVAAPFRGNVPTRVRKIREGLADATFLAVAGLKRLKLDDNIAEIFTAERITPPMGQGALAIETRMGDLTALMSLLNHEPARLAVEAERAFIGRIGGGCRTPAGALAEWIEAHGDGEGSAAAGQSAGVWRLTGMIASDDGKSLLRRSVEISGSAVLAEIIARATELADAMVADADDAIRATLHPRLGS